MSKPDPGIYALACERLRVEPAQLVFLDDSEQCVEGARQAGMNAVLYQDNLQAVGEIGGLLAVTGNPQCRRASPAPDMAATFAGHRPHTGSTAVRGAARPADRQRRA